MINVYIGMTSADFIAAVNANVDPEYGCSEITINSTLNTLNDNYTIIKSINPNYNVLEISAGMRANSFINVVNNNAPNNLKRYVYKALGTTIGTTAQIYKSKAWIDSQVFTEKVIAPEDIRTLSPANKYVAFGWADYFPMTDSHIMLALANKYGMSETHYRQIIPKTDDYKNTFRYSRSELKMIESSGSYDANHSYSHITFITAYPLYDGMNTPSNDDLRVERVDGTNELSHNIAETVDTSLSVSVRKNWLLLSDTLGGKAWQDLTDVDCIAFRKSVSAYGMPLDGQNLQKVLESLDYLSTRYCGTTGYSVLNGDYIIRTPNTVGGVEPDVTHLIQGGIFQGSATTCNHEIWERILKIDSDYKYEFEGKLKPHRMWSTPGGGDKNLTYNIINATTNGAYVDKEHTQLFTGASMHTSSILNISRSFHDCLRAAGYKLTNAIQGQGYGIYSDDLITPTEGRRIFKLNSNGKKLDNVGDGGIGSIRPWEAAYTVTDIDNALASSDVVKYLFDLTTTDGRWPNSALYSFSIALKEMMESLAWGVIPCCIDDSGTYDTLTETARKQSSMALQQEAILQFFKRAGIEMISWEQGYDISQMNYYPVNYFPNPNFDKILETILVDSVNTPTYPDGWRGGTVIGEDTGSGVVNILYYNPGSAGTIYTRTYTIKPPNTYTLSFRAKGVGYLQVRTIKNNQSYYAHNNIYFTIVNTIVINSPSSYTEYTAQIVVPDNALETYDTPVTPAERAYQNYWKGYGEKICGLGFELTVSGTNYVKIGNCSLIV